MNLRTANTGKWFLLSSAIVLCLTASAADDLYKFSGHAEFLNRANAGLVVSGILQPESKTCIWRMIADVPQVIEAVRKLYFERNLGAELGANGRAFVQDYAPERMAGKWHDIFQSVVTPARQYMPAQG
jgi:hypothetical protein